MFNLVKKDFMVLKKYWIFLVIFPVAGPIFITHNIGISNSSFISFFITLIFLEFILYGTLSRLEEKDKGNILLSTIPYSRAEIVISKYIFVGAVFVIAYILYTLAVFISPIDVKALNISSIVISFLLIAICFGISIPTQYKYGTEKTKYISSILIFLSPFLIPKVVNWVQSKNIDLNIINKTPDI
ncbi:hypothetical protein AVM15_02160, partial [Paraclostridium benzoelyticum]